MSESDSGLVGHCTSTLLYLVCVPYTNHRNVSHGPFFIVQCIASHAREPYNCLLNAHILTLVLPIYLAEDQFDHHPKVLGYTFTKEKRKKKGN